MGPNIAVFVRLWVILEAITLVAAASTYSHRSYVKVSRRFHQHRRINDHSSGQTVSQNAVTNSQVPVAPEPVQHVHLDPCQVTVCPEGHMCVAIESQCNGGELVADCQPMKATTNICREPRDKGDVFCNGRHSRWYYDSEIGRCRRLLYSGCGGNNNNFPSRDMCERACVREKVCCFRSDPGPCRANIPRWYFDSIDGACKQFTYGGCKGNGNNFETELQCQGLCTY
ncbi:papilin-like [Lingula anatina]|uniref:Papilin-like n=1 Tax=Lingula anatina TaxID=7574 RepID=A0A1S3JRS0_LINAN|nr:papilin-like [Lingula anatina]|eukprot:XP_013413037.1 papilin-like [Lingula anatina]